MAKRVFLIVLDSFGIGQAPDAKSYGDLGSNTIKTIASSESLNIPTLTKLGLFNIDGVSCKPKIENPIGSFARLEELSAGKDSTTGHWEMAGIITKTPFPTFKKGFPKNIINKLEKAWGKKVLCNKPYSGTQVIIDYGCEHIKTGNPIVYTSADSVLQIACHEEVIPLSQLYTMCKQAREIMTGKYGVGRIIARPFLGEYPNFYRTSNRHDFSLIPPTDNLLEQIIKNNLEVIAIGKIDDMFAHQNISITLTSTDNNTGMNQLLSCQNKDFSGLCWINLCDFDMKFGHRNDIDGYAKALTNFDAKLNEFISNMKEDDALIITADHGCDPATESTDHSREYVPFILYYKPIEPKNLGTLKGFNHVGATILNLLSINSNSKTLNSDFNLNI